MEVISVLLDNWEVLGLILTNIVALFMQPPFRKKESHILFKSDSKQK